MSQCIPSVKLLYANKNRFTNFFRSSFPYEVSLNHIKFILNKLVCTTKEMVPKLKRLPPEQEKIFASYTSDKGLIIRICKELKKLNPQKSMTQ
jgi:hypothetical protein